MKIFSLLANRTLAGLWFSYSISVMATSLLPTVVTLMVLDGPGGIAALGVVLACRTLGFLVGAVVGGYFADLWPRPRVLAAASILRGSATLAIALLLPSDVVAISACLLLAGSGEGVFRSAYQATLADILAPEQRQGANVLTTLSMRISMTAGPLLAVSLNTTLGARLGLVLAGGLWMMSGATIFLLQGRLGTPLTHPDGGDRNFIRDYRDGLLEAWRHRWFSAGLVALVIWLGVGNSTQLLMLPMISRGHLGGDAFIGFALAAYSLGALAGGVLLGSLVPARPGRWAFAGLSLYGLVPLALASHSRELILASYFVGGLGIELFNILWFTAIQNEIPSHMLGRISSIDFLISYGISPLTLALIPAYFASVDEWNALVSTGVLVIAVPLVALVTPGAVDLREPRSSPHRCPLYRSL